MQMTHKEKIFYPWAEAQKDYWLYQHKDKIQIIGISQKDHWSDTKKKYVGKLTIIYYKETK